SSLPVEAFLFGVVCPPSPPAAYEVGGFLAFQGEPTTIGLSGSPSSKATMTSLPPRPISVPPLTFDALALTSRSLSVSFLSFSFLPVDAFFFAVISVASFDLGQSPATIPATDFARLPPPAMPPFTSLPCRAVVLLTTRSLIFLAALDRPCATFAHHRRLL